MIVFSGENFSPICFYSLRKVPLQTDFKLPVGPCSRVPGPLQNEASPNRRRWNFHDGVVRHMSCLSFQLYGGQRHSSWVFVKWFIQSGTSYPRCALTILCGTASLVAGTSANLRPPSRGGNSFDGCASELNHVRSCWFLPLAGWAQNVCRVNMFG